MKRYHIKIIKHATSNNGRGFYDTLIVAEDFEFKSNSIVFYNGSEIVAVYPAINTIIEKIEKI
jgi:hypothetical protein